ncbi:MAG TPA: hypothetical protein PKX27_13370 [Bacteroidales bacterium]|nr:hypothetical protein [Bacteroidales bacterium]HPM88969.1 hypothetical protein [Bacteroidales bacterium]HQM70533.1 hypothetical protein [Bacteroidales bacterium]
MKNKRSKNEELINFFLLTSNALPTEAIAQAGSNVLTSINQKQYNTFLLRTKWH